MYSLFVTQLFNHTFTVSFSYTLPLPDALMYNVGIFVKWNEPFLSVWEIWKLSVQLSFLTQGQKTTT